MLLHTKVETQMGGGGSPIPHLRDFDADTFEDLLLVTLYRMAAENRAPPGAKVLIDTSVRLATGNDVQGGGANKYVAAKWGQIDHRGRTEQFHYGEPKREHQLPKLIEDARMRRCDVASKATGKTAEKGTDQAYWCELFNVRHVRVLDATSRGHVGVEELLTKACAAGASPEACDLSHGGWENGQRTRRLLFLELLTLNKRVLNGQVVSAHWEHYIAATIAAQRAAGYLTGDKHKAVRVQVAFKHHRGEARGEDEHGFALVELSNYVSLDEIVRRVINGENVAELNHYLDSADEKKCLNGTVSPKCKDWWKTQSSQRKENEKFFDSVLPGIKRAERLEEALGGHARLLAGAKAQQQSIRREVV